jgi:phosphatidylglycerophosphate synthase
MHKLADVKEKAKRKNDVANKRLHPFAARISIYFSWIFINLGLTPNQVTGIFFLTGLAGTFVLYMDSVWAIVISYICFRMHIVFDVCDGEVARYTKLYSLNGSYYDYMIHALLYPLFFIAMCITQYLHWGNDQFTYLAIFGTLAVSLSMIVKNNYYRALLFNRRTIDEFKSKTDATPKSGFKFQVFMIVTELLGFEGLFIGYFICHLIGNQDLFLLLLLIYSLAFLMKTLAKFYQLSTKGYYNTKS